MNATLITVLESFFEMKYDIIASNLYSLSLILESFFEMKYDIMLFQIQLIRL